MAAVILISAAGSAYLGAQTTDENKIDAEKFAHT